MSDASPRVAIVDYGLGNLYSVQRACEHVGLQAAIVSDPEEVRSAAGVILPGVGAMPTAMSRLRDTGLADALVDCARRETPLLGICLGLQLLMRTGSEFGEHQGLGIVGGRVVRFEATTEQGDPLRVPHIGWNAIRPSPGATWAGTPLEGTEPGTMMYFVHSFYVVPADPGVCVATARYGPVDFCAAIATGSVFACQFHPERSGPAGLALYERFARRIHHPVTS